MHGSVEPVVGIDAAAGQGIRAPEASQLLLYGVTGYSGELILNRALEVGLRPIVAGRDHSRVLEVATRSAKRHGLTEPLQVRSASLHNAAEVSALLRDVTVLLHCAGPFVHTYQAMVDACLHAGVHYLDITGEVPVFEAIAARHADAIAANIMLMPGTGFDVVPSDCLAAHLHQRLPTATSLALGFRALGGVSRGTALTMIENLGRPGCVRRDGRLVAVPPAYHARTIDFGDGPKLAVTIPWGDVSTAYHSTGIPDIRVYMSVHRKQLAMLRRSRYIGWVLRRAWVQRRLAAKVRARAAGPSAEARARGVSLVWGEVTAPDGTRCVSRLRGPEGYTLTAHTAVHIAQRVLAGEWTPGFATPSTAYGSEVVLQVAGVTFHDDIPQHTPPPQR